jgi:hypothetical protein
MTLPGSKRLGDPITTGQATWAILKEIKTPIVGDLTLYSSVGYALQHCVKEEVYACLSGGEKRLVNIAMGVHGGNEDYPGSGVAALGGLDRTLRRKVLLILFYLYLGHDLSQEPPANYVDLIDWSVLRER